MEWSLPPHNRGVIITTRIAQPSELRITDEFRTALEFVDQGKNFFLTGKAGTGKSTLVRMIMSNGKRNTIVAAPTGIAALNVGGMTIHRLFGNSETEFFTSTYVSPYFFDANSFSTPEFPTVQLTKVFRQEGDQGLINVLNSVRDGRVLNDQLTLLNAHVNPTFEMPSNELWLTLTSTNRIANARNHTMLDGLPGEERVSRAEVSGDLSEFDPPTEHDLPFKVGAQVMMLTNHPSGTWVNGTLATIAEIDDSDDGTSVTIKLPDGTQHEVHRHTWQATRAGVSDGRLTSEPVGTFTQLPFRLAWAITIHKSQGQTLERAVVDLSGGTFADGQLYVALSRLTSIDGLVLTRPIVPKDLHTNTRVRRFLQTGATHVATRGRAYIGVCMVGDVGSTWRPRPVELAVVTDDGQEFTTLVNPERDLGAARQAYGVTAGDVQLAPTLAEAWGALSNILGGYVPVGIDIDTTLGHLEFELKRNGAMPLIPLGDRYHRPLDANQKLALSAPAALERAQATRAIMRGEPPTPGSSPFESAAKAVGYLNPRGSSGHFLVTGTADSDAASTLARMLEPRVSLMNLAPDTKAVLAGIDRHDDSHVLTPFLKGQPSTPIESVLVSGARVCFSGSAVDGRGQHLEKEDLKSLARAHGLTSVDNVTKTKCDVLVTAEAGSQSGKAKTAAKWGKPVFTAKEFLAWTAGEAPVTTDHDAAVLAAPVEITSLTAATAVPEQRLDQSRESPVRRPAAPRRSGSAIPAMRVPSAPAPAPIEPRPVGRTPVPAPERNTTEPEPSIFSRPAWYPPEAPGFDGSTGSQPQFRSIATTAPAPLALQPQHPQPAAKRSHFHRNMAFTVLALIVGGVVGVIVPMSISESLVNVATGLLLVCWLGAIVAVIVWIVLGITRR